MSIHDKRLEIEINNIIKRNLSNGYVPTASEVIGELSRYLIDNNLSVPAYKYTGTKNFTAGTLNDAKAAVGQDLDIVYGALIDLYELANEQINKFSVEKKKYDYKLSKLESKLTSLVNRYSSDGYTLGYRDNFSDMENIDTMKTTADIDIANYEATLKRLQDIPYKNFSISVDSGNMALTQNGSISNLINTDGIVWQGVIESATQETVSLVINIDTKTINQINKISLDMPLLKKCAVSVLSSTDGDKWNTEYSGEVSAQCTANISNKLRYIRIVLSKTEADKFNLGKYQYFFIVDNITMDSINYALESEIVSKPISVGTNVNKVSLVTETVAPPATSIDYYVAINADTPVWVPISPLNSTNQVNPTVISFNTVETDQRLSISIPDGVSNDAYELKSYSVNGQRLFAIAEIDVADITSYKLYKGINAWKVESLAISALQPQTHSVFITNPANIKTRYTPIIIDKPGLIMNSEIISENTIRNYSTTIYRDTGDMVYKEIVASSHPIAVYLNGIMLYKGTPTGGTAITYPFKKGSNLLEVITTISGAPTTCSVDLNLPLTSIGSTICANEAPMTPVSLFDLRYNTNNQLNVYTLLTANDKYTVIVKDPDLAIRYEMVYDYTIEPINEVLLKAILRREHSSVNITPRLISYEIKFV